MKLNSILRIAFTAFIGLSFVACDKNEEDRLNFPVPELTAENTISFTVTIPGHRYFSINSLAGDKVAIYWGDGTENGYRVLEPEPVSHEFKSAGTYHIQIWSENLTELELTAHSQSITDLEIGNCPKLTDLILMCFEEESFKLSGCPKLDNLTFRSWDNLISLDLTECNSIKRLYCSSLPKMTSLDVSKNTLLTDIDIEYTPIKELDLSRNIMLNTFQCVESDLTSLSLEKNNALTELYISDNTQLTSINVDAENNIKMVWCRNNKMESLDLKNFTVLRYLDCRESNLSSLDLSSCSELLSVNFQYNNIATITLPEKPKIRNFLCSFNQLNAETLNGIFTALPDAAIPYPGTRESLTEPSYSVIQYNGNPGEKECNVEIIKKKGWRVGVATEKKE
ncbi:MAG: hypothetical protein LUH22_12055 [Bacteroides sp.]|nr:hypothetical protein [Bacteroides sp.]